jgi:hypothetical protein
VFKHCALLFTTSKEDFFAGTSKKSVSTEALRAFLVVLDGAIDLRLTASIFWVDER